MRIKLIHLICFCLIISCFLSSCTYKTTYHFYHPIEDISSIEIVVAHEDDVNFLEEQTVLATIEDHEAFLNDFNNMILRSNIFSSPAEFPAEYLAVKFAYTNGDYELCVHAAKALYRVEYDGIDPYRGAGHFEKKEFLALLSKYLGYTVDSYTDYELPKD